MKGLIMTLKIKSPILCLLVAAVPGLLTGCATPSKPNPTHVSDQFGGAQITKLGVLPLIDARFDKGEKMNYEKINRGIRKFTEYHLQKRGFEPIYLLEATPPAGKQGLLEHPDPELLKAICPDEYPHCLLFIVEDLIQDRNFLGTQTGLTVSMGLVDGRTGSVLWHDTDVRRTAEGGLVGLGMSNVSEYNLVCQCAEVMVKKLPDRRSQ